MTGDQIPRTRPSHCTSDVDECDRLFGEFTPNVGESGA